MAAFRVALGVVLLADLALRARWLGAFYTDAGVLPRAALRARRPGYHALSIHALSGEAWVQALLFAVAAAFALALLAGYRTRPATVASFVLLVSLQARNPFVLNSGDVLLRHLLLWGAFLPLGRRWSVDASGGDPGKATGPERVAGVASAGLLCQVVLVYAVNAALKLRGDGWVAGRAVRYAFSLDAFTVLLGNYLADYPALLVAFDRLWLGLLVCSPLLILLTGWGRAALAAAFAAMHAGIALTIGVGVFPAVSVTALLPFVPGRAWDAAERSAVGRALSRRTGTGRAMRSVRRATRSRRSGRESNTGASGIVRRIVRQKPTIAVVPMPGTPGIDRAGRAARRLAPAVAAVLLFAMLAWNAATVGLVPVPGGVQSVADPADRRWDMFAPYPPRADGWYVVPGRLESGRQIDAFQRGPLAWDRPPDPARTYPTARWRKYLGNVRRADDDGLRRAFAAYLCRRWNADHSDDLVGLAVYYVEQPTRLDGREPIRRSRHLQYDCPG
ncbi:HTTM domain-containing protein [Halobacteriales archaeon QS_1_68_17]|nr:MAG: HTTM domain-containing protein [Halobacteriales archaeon QS_1_68_17]